ncbi:MAG: hypothetical protein BWY31_01438 [Lentisphaerae bacterium ADurb.Bin242]|nr:MAG: hypothetical protein BWY31_01438 [Lentisphaerae bacterium ADurb.Bin242]
MKWKRFTLIELLIVISIIAILAGMLLPALNRARNSAQAIKCLGQLKQNGLVFFQYIDDNREFYPTTMCYYPPWPYGAPSIYFTRYLRHHYFKLPVGYTFYNRDTQYCPSETKHNQGEIGTDYAFNYNVIIDASNSLKATKVHSDTLITGDHGTGAVSPVSYLLNEWTAANYLAFRHSKQTNALFADGSARAVRKNSVKTSMLTPGKD